MSKNKKKSFVTRELAEKTHLRTIYLARAAGMVLFYFLSLILIFVLLNYLALLLSMIGNSIHALAKQTTAASTDFSFQARYLVFVMDPFPAWLPFVLAAAATIFRGWWLVKKIEQLIRNSKLDYAWNDVEGSARWASPEEIREILQPIPKTDLHSAKKGGIILYEDQDNYYADTSTSHSIILGKTRSGKDQYLLLPSARLIIESQEKSSLVFTDPKLELYEYLYPILKENGYRIWILNFRDPDKGMCCSDLNPCLREYKRAMEMDPEERDFSRTKDRVGEYAFIQTANPKSDPVWPECAKSLLQALLFLLMDIGYQNGTLDKLNMYTVRTYFIDKGTKEIKFKDGSKTVELDLIMQALPIEHPARQAYATSKFADGEMRSGIFASLSSNLDIYADTGIAKLTTGRQEDPMDFAELADPNIPTALFLGIPDDRKNRDKMATTYINQVYTELVEVAQSYPNNLLPRRVIIMANEIGNLPAFPNLDTMLQVSLGRNIMWYFAVQNLAQLEKVYGEKESRIIRDSATNYIYIYSSDQVIVKEVSEMLGTATKAFTTTSGDHGSLLEAEHTQGHLKGRSLMMADELRLLQEGEFIVFHDRCRVIRSTMTPFWKLGYNRIPIEKTTYTTAKQLKISELLMPYNTDSSAPVKANKKEARPPVDDERNKLLSSRLVISKTLHRLTGNRFLAALEAQDFSQARSLAVEQNDLGSFPPDDLAIIQDMLAEYEQQNNR